MRFTTRDHFAVEPATFWRELFFSQPFLQRMYREALACDRLELVNEQGDLATTLSRTMRFTQRVDASAPVRKLFGDTATMQEDGVFDAAAGRWRWEIRPDRMTERVRIGGETWLEPAAGGVNRVVDTEIDVRMFGIGALVEHYVARQSARSAVQQTAFMRGFIAETGLK